VHTDLRTYVRTYVSIIPQAPKRVLLRIRSTMQQECDDACCGSSWKLPTLTQMADDVASRSRRGRRHEMTMIKVYRVHERGLLDNFWPFLREGSPLPAVIHLHDADASYRASTIRMRKTFIKDRHWKPKPQIFKDFHQGQKYCVRVRLGMKCFCQGSAEFQT
jgi:hypothetical protein